MVGLLHFEGLSGTSFVELEQVEKRLISELVQLKSVWLEAVKIQIMPVPSFLLFMQRGITEQLEPAPAVIEREGENTLYK